MGLAGLHLPAPAGLRLAPAALHLQHHPGPAMLRCLCCSQPRYRPDLPPAMAAAEPPAVAVSPDALPVMALVTQLLEQLTPSPTGCQSTWRKGTVTAGVRNTLTIQT